MFKFSHLSSYVCVNLVEKVLSIISRVLYLVDQATFTSAQPSSTPPGLIYLGIKNCIQIPHWNYPLRIAEEQLQPPPPPAKKKGASVTKVTEHINRKEKLFSSATTSRTRHLQRQDLNPRLGCVRLARRQTGQQRLPSAERTTISCFSTQASVAQMKSVSYTAGTSTLRFDSFFGWLENNPLLEEMIFLQVDFFKEIGWPFVRGKWSLWRMQFHSRGLADPLYVRGRVRFLQ